MLIVLRSAGWWWLLLVALMSLTGVGVVDFAGEVGEDDVSEENENETPRLQLAASSL
jgi:hypothetical protein